MAMLALVVVIASDRLTITSASNDKHQVLSAGMTTAITGSPSVSSVAIASISRRTRLLFIENEITVG